MFVDCYIYWSMFNYWEVGSFYVDGIYLFICDIFNQASIEKVVEIFKFVNDMFQFKMMDGDKEWFLMMVKW